jgi:hypothetical protein
MHVVHAIILAVLLSSLACNKSTRPAAAPIEFAPPAETEPIQNSGQKLIGTYSARVMEDYRRDAPVREAQMRYSFDDAGGFKRERLASGRIVSTELGSYIVGTRNELVLYVESANGENLGAARAERFVIEAWTDQSLTLKYGSGRLLLEK